jgi:BirA family biotin operon repressor/biotin-[acetyl-CoA-carboxylase] ligase
LRLLADGARHSGEQLARTLGLSRAAVWKQIRRAQDQGLRIDAVRGRGYRLAQPLELLDREQILYGLSAELRGSVERFEIFEELESTNSFLCSGAKATPGKLLICLAEYQTGGRGRRGRSWQMPFGGGLSLSVGWLFPMQPPDLPALALATGVVARRVLIEHTGLAVQIKWPNDLLYGDRKLGGILVELAAESHGPCHAVIGLGINISATPELPSGSDAWAGGATDLAAAAGGPAPSRNALAGALIAGLAALLREYANSGFAAYRLEFGHADYLFGRSIHVAGLTGGVTGTAAGLDEAGALLVATGSGVTKVISGEVSVRATA